MPKPANSFNQLAGVPTHYAREPIAPYGTRGKLHTFYCVEAFETKLDAMFSDLWKRCPLGKAEVITSAGAYVEKPGWHGKGLAFDLDAIFWANKDFVTKRYPVDTRFYLGVESVLRRHFGTILAYTYNEPHEDHFHIQDDGVSAGFATSRKTCVLFVQSVLKHLYSAAVKVTGSFDAETDAELKKLLKQLGIGTLGTVANYLKFLEAVQIEAFGGGGVVGGTETTSSVEKTPVELLRLVYTTIESELGETAARKRIETALTAFADSLPDALLQESSPVEHTHMLSVGEFTIDTDLKKTVSPLTAKAIDDFFVAQPKENRTLAGIGAPVISAAKKYGINAAYIVAHAILETGWGNSKIAKEKNNLFGWSAFDSSPFESAKGFPSREACIDFVMGRVNELYLDPKGKYFNTAPCLGKDYKTGYGMNRNYASDHKWGKKIASIATRIEKSLA